MESRQNLVEDNPSYYQDISDRFFDDCIYDSIVCHEKFGMWNQLELLCAVECNDCAGRYDHTRSIIIAVDGACRNHGTTNARAAYAAYFHHKNTTYNSSSLLSGPVQTNQRAELSAGLLALQLASHIKDLNDPSRPHERLTDEDDGPEAILKYVVIKSDSEYLVNGMTSWIRNWKLNGFRNSKKKPVVNTDLFKALEEEIIALNDRGVVVQFWHVMREQNKMADYLANCLLDGITAKEATERIVYGEH